MVDPEPKFDPEAYKAGKKFEQKGYKTLQKFVDKRIKSLNKMAGLDVERLEEVINELWSEYRGNQQCPDWAGVYNKISDNLRKADLTINFRCTSWFSDANTYKAYTQMYQRGVDKATGEARMWGDALNPAALRAAADDIVTMPPSWAHGSRSQKKIYNTMNYSGYYMPKTGMHKYNDMGKLPFGGDLSLLVHATGKFETEDVVRTTNEKFNPHAKQVFTALNYGRRPYGSCTQYGKSYLVLSTELKKKALYFPQDTFYEAYETRQAGHQTAKRLAATGRCAADTQSSYDWIGHVLVWASGVMAGNLFKSCHDGIVLPESASANDLLEAHIFSDVRIDRDVVSMHLAREPDMTIDQWDEVKMYAYGWAKANGIKVYLTDGAA